jgi:hypothetical protein
LSFLHPFSKLREPFVGPSGVILELSTAALDFVSLSVIVSNSNVELVSNFGLGRNAAGKD